MCLVLFSIVLYRTIVIVYTDNIFLYNYLWQMHQIIHLSRVGCFTPARGKTVQKNREVMVKSSFHSHNPENINRFIMSLSSHDWSFPDGEGLPDHVTRFTDAANNLNKNYFHLKIKYVSTKRLTNPLISSAILKSIKIKSYYFKLLN